MTFESTPSANARTAAIEARPLYQQTRDLLLKRIIDGVWKPGSYLPSEQQLCGELGVSIGTIRKATEDLVIHGLLERQHGRGTQVVPHSSAKSRFRFLRFVHEDGRPLDPVAHLLTQTVRAASAEERRQLDLDPSGKVLALTRIRSEKDQPLVYERLALPAQTFAALGLKTGEDIVEEVYVFYQERCGVTIMRTVDEVGLAVADTDMARHLGIAKGAPVLEVRRVAHALDGRRVEYRESFTAHLKYKTALE